MTAFLGVECQSDVIPTRKPLTPTRTRTRREKRNVEDEAVVLVPLPLWMGCVVCHLLVNNDDDWFVQSKDGA